MHESDPQRRTEILKAIAHPARITILEILRRGEECVCRICPELVGSQPNTSKHLGVMKRAGILESGREGSMSFYWVQDTRVYEILDLVDQIVRRKDREQVA